MRLPESRAITIFEQFKNKRVQFINNLIEICLVARNVYLLQFVSIGSHYRWLQYRLKLDYFHPHTYTHTNRFDTHAKTTIPYIELENI